MHCQSGERSLRGRRQQFASKLRVGAGLDWGAVTVSGYCFMLAMAVPYRKQNAGLDAPLWRLGKTSYIYVKKKVDDCCQTVSAGRHFIPCTTGRRANQVFWESVTMIRETLLPWVLYSNNLSVKDIHLSLTHCNSLLEQCSFYIKFSFLYLQKTA